MGKTFHGVRDGVGSGVEDMVNGALAEQFHTLQSTVVDEGAKRGRRGRDASVAAVVRM